MSKILILHTGGTIGMTWTSEGYKPDGKNFREAIYHMDSLKAYAMPEWDFMETFTDPSVRNKKRWQGQPDHLDDHRRSGKSQGSLHLFRRSAAAGQPGDQIFRQWHASL